MLRTMLAEEDSGLTWVDYVTVVVAAAALLVSLAGLHNARQARKTAARAEHLARTPQLSATFVPRLGGHYNLRLFLKGPADLRRLEVELVSLDAFGRGLLGVSDDRMGANAQASTSVDVGPVRVAESRDLALWRNGPMSGAAVRLRCVCEADGEREPWFVHIEETAPADA